MKLFSWLFSIDRFGRENPDYSKFWFGNLKTWIARKNENWNGIFGNIQIDFCFFLLDASIFMSLAPFHGTNAGYMAVSHPFLCCSHFLKDDMKNRGGLELPKWFLLGFFGPKSSEATKKNVVFHQPPELHVFASSWPSFSSGQEHLHRCPQVGGWGQMQAIP